MLFSNRLFTVTFVGLLVICVECGTSDLDNSVQSEVYTENVGEEGKHLGDPLFLTPYIEQGKLNQGRQLALVTPLVGKVKSYAGYLTVDKKRNSNMFFWYFESENDHKKDPTVVWLQGGPGTSSLFGAFVENGPYVITDKQKVLKRANSWSKVSNIVYFDNPVGTGYSFTKDEAGYAINQTKVGNDLYNAILQFLELFPNLQKNNFFISGESYAGKYIPALARTIHLKNKQHPHIHVNLKGLMIGNGFTDPRHMMHYSEYLYQIGLIDANAKRKIHHKENLIIRYINHKKWHRAQDVFKRMMDIIYFRYSGLSSYNNFYNPDSGKWNDYHQQFVTSTDFRKRIHVGNKAFNDGSLVYKMLYDDMPKSVINWVADLLDHYRILFYNGQLDIIGAYPLTLNFLRNMDWPLKHEYRVAKRHRYYVGGDVAGYFKTVGNLTELVMRNAGHMVPTDQPLWSLQLLQDFTLDNIAPRPAKNDTSVKIDNTFTSIL